MGVGSFLGGVLRYGLSTWVHRLLDNSWFPYGTLAVNALGCLLIGFLAGLIVEIVGATEKIEAFLPVIDGAIADGLATVEKVQIRFYRASKAQRMLL